MANVYDYGPIVIDLKDYYTMRTECHQLDDVTLNFIVNNYDQEINIENFNVELRFKKPDGNDLIQKKDIKVVNNNIKIKCDSQLTIVSGKAKGELRLWESNGEQKTTCIIELNIISSALEVDRGISKTLITELEHLDNSLNGLYEAVDKIDKTKDEAIKLESDLRENINIGTTINNKLESNIPIATGINTKLENNIEIGTKLNTDLEGNITEGSTLKENLEANILTGTTLKTELEEDIQEGSTLDAALKEDIKNANIAKEQLGEIKQQADTSKESLETATTTANTTKEELTNIDTTAKKTIEDLQVENVLADEKIETLKKLDPSNVLEDVGNLKQEVTEARGVYPNLNKRIENIIGKDVANLYIGETEPALDGLWVDTTENVGEFGSSDLLEDIKDYVNTDINPKIEENKKSIESINKDLNENTQNINTHKSNLATDTTGVHGLKMETGTWTPIVRGSVTVGSNTYTTQVGRYIKINNLVNCWFRIVVSKGSDISGNISITGLPYVILANNANRPGLQLAVINNTTLPSGRTQFVGYGVPTEARIELAGLGSNIMNTFITAENLGVQVEITGALTYETNL